MINKLLSILCGVILFFSCINKTKNEINKVDLQPNIKISFKKIDSVQIDYIGNPTVHDLDPVSRIVLFMEHKESSQIITVASFDGQVLSSFSKWGDMPDSYGNLMASLNIIGSNSFMAYGSRGFFAYTFEGKLQSYVKHSDDPYIGFNRIGIGFGMERLKDLYIYLNQDDYYKLNDESDNYAKLQPVIALNFNSGEAKPIIGFPKTSIFLSGRYFFNNAWDPAFTVADDRIVVAFGLEPTLYIFSSAAAYSLITKLPLDLPKYQYFEGGNEYSSDVRFFGQARTSGKILNVKKLDGFYMIAYFPGFDASDLEESFANKPPKETMEFWNNMQKKYSRRIAIVDSLGNVVNDFVPQGLEPSSMLIRNGELWMLEKPDEEIELDFFRLFRVGLKIEN